MVTVLLFSSLLLWEYGLVDLTVAYFVFAGSTSYPIWRAIDRRSLAELGIGIRGLAHDVRQNWCPIAILLVLIALLERVAEWCYLPFREFTISSSPVDPSANPVLIFALVVVMVPFYEEALYRGVLQRYASAFAPDRIALVYSSAVFAFLHFAAGDLLSMALAFTGHFVRGCIYGLVYSRSQNALVSFIPHSLWNLSVLIVP